jgi:hypothetical protein
LDICREDPVLVIRRLLELQQHALARKVFSILDSVTVSKVSKIFSLATISAEIEESYLMYLFSCNGKVYSRLYLISTRKAKSI